MARRRLQEGKVTPLKNGSHRIEWYEYVKQLDGTERRAHRSLTIQGSKSAARLKLQAIIADVQTARADSSVTLREFVMAKWRPLHASKWRSDSTRQTNDQIIRTHILEPLGNLELGQIDKPRLQAHLNVIAETLSYSPVQHVHSFLRSIFEECVEQDYLRKSPARSLEMPRCQREESLDLEDGKPTLTIQQLRDLVGAFSGRDRLIVCLAALTAARPSEIFAARWDCLTFDSFSGTTQDFLQTPDGLVPLGPPSAPPCDLAITSRVYRGSIGQPKTPASRARLPVPDLLAAALMRYRESCAQNTYLFQSFKGTPISKANWLVRTLYPVAREALPGVVVNFQVLRRTWCTLSEEYGADRAVRVAVMRHSRTGLGVTEGTYRQILRPAMIGPMNKLAAAVLSGTPEQAKLPEPLPELQIETGDVTNNYEQIYDLQIEAKAI
jgi:integrase